MGRTAVEASQANWSQFHYGSIQINIEKLATFDSKRSQFHYGSIQIREEQPTADPVEKVSIPLWFDSNEKMCVLILNDRKSLNSTMVRFKSGLTEC